MEGGDKSDIVLIVANSIIGRTLGLDGFLAMAHLIQKIIINQAKSILKIIIESVRVEVIAILKNDLV